MKRMIFALLALLPLLAPHVYGHSGGLDAQGCHRNHKTGDYHCHRSPPPAPISPPPSPSPAPPRRTPISSPPCSPAEGHIPPTIIIRVRPEVLSPSNKQLVTVKVWGNIVDESDSQVSRARYQVIDEYGEVQPSGDFAPNQPDGSYAFTVKLNALPQGNDRDGRQYTIVVHATDKAGHLGSADASVTFPRK